MIWALGWILVGLMVFVALTPVREHWRALRGLESSFQKAFYAAFLVLMVVSWPLVLFMAVAVKALHLEKKMHEVGEEVVREIDKHKEGPPP